MSSIQQLRNHTSLFIEQEDEDHHPMAMAGFSSFPNSDTSSTTTNMNRNYPQTTLNNHSNQHSTGPLLKPSHHQLTAPDETLITSSSHHLLSLHHRSYSHAHLWAWGELNESFANDRRSLPSGTHGGDRDRDWNHHHLHCSSVHLGVSAMKMKKMSNKSRKKVREPRFSFKTLSDVDVLDDGYKWRKYGQKVVKNTQHPRSYYRCTQDSCRVKKRVERLAEDPRMVITTYEGRHAHTPSQDMDDSQDSHLNNDFFW